MFAGARILLSGQRGRIPLVVVLAVVAWCGGVRAGERSDSPLRVQATAVDGVLRIVVDVADDHIVWDGEHVDSVAVQLADDALVTDAVKQRQATEQQRTEIDEALAERERTPELLAAVRNGYADALQRWGAAERALVTTVASRPGVPAPAPSSSRYTRTPRGYRATVTIPLAGVLSPASGSVQAVRYRVTVADVDGDAAPVTSLPANSDDAPSTFARVALPRPWRPRLNHAAKVARDLVPGGCFDFRDGAYAYVVPDYECTDWTFNGTCCTPVVCWQTSWSAVDVDNVSRLAGTQLYVGDEAVLFMAGGRRVRLLLTDAELLFQTRRGDAYYFVFMENQPSRPGNPMAQCGAGSETSVVWIKLSPALVELRRETVLVDSCWYSMENDYRVDAAGISGETDRIDERTGDATARLSYRYDHRHPQRGLVVKEVPPH